jgi:hypothetical protein
MKPSLSTIVKTLNAAPAGAITLGGCTYTLIESVGRHKIAAFPQCDATSIERTDHDKAMQLYGTEERAATEIRRQLATMGADVCPAVRKRAEKLAERMEQGHTLRPEYKTAYNWARKKHVPVEPRVILHYLPTTMHTKKVLGEALNRNEWDIRWGNVNISESNINNLRKRGFTINTIK